MRSAIDLFCGSGAVTLGLRRAGFHVVGAVDIDATACATYRDNHPGIKLVEDDIRAVDPTIFLSLLPDGLDLLAVCAPCQPFSRRNRDRSTSDARREFVLAALPFIDVLRPAVVFFENVPELGRHSVFACLARRLEALSYHAGSPREIDAANMGVAQHRQRFVLIATRKAVNPTVLQSFPQPDRATVAQAFWGLPDPSPPGTKEPDDPLHVAKSHSALTIERLRHIPADGGSRDSLPERLRLHCHRGLKPNQFPDTYGRLCWDRPAPTLTTGCNDLTKGRYAHPVEDRAITLREAARLQSFPDEYRFRGTVKEIAAQIGNAVPPKMAEEIGRELYAFLSRVDVQSGR